MTPMIILVRHGATEYNGGGHSTERLRGWKDVPLSHAGRMEASGLGAELADVDASAVYTSDLSRAKDTANEIARRQKLTAKTDAGLRPWDQGELTGKPASEYVPVMKEYISKRPDEKIPGSSETFNQFKARTVAEFQKYGEIAKKADGPVILVAHARNARMLRGWLDKGSNGEIDLRPLLAEDDPIDPGMFMVIRFRNGRWIG
jgi:broad specificity phosphatase PhoE